MLVPQLLVECQALSIKPPRLCVISLLLGNPPQVVQHSSQSMLIAQPLEDFQALPTESPGFLVVRLLNGNHAQGPKRIPSSPLVSQPLVDFQALSIEPLRLCSWAIAPKLCRVVARPLWSPSCLKTSRF